MATQADQVRDDILERVLLRQLMPGDRIDEVELKNRLKLSGTPVREALISLEESRVIQRRPRGGARIAALDLEGLVKMIEVLAELEASGAFLAARRINTTQAKRLQSAADACSAFVQSPCPGGPSYFDLNLDFHRAVAEAAGNEYLTQSMFHVGNRLVAYLDARTRLPGQNQRSAEDHQNICRAILDAKGDEARRLMLEHVNFDGKQAIDIMNTLSRMSDD